jgi:hypothetical protein
MDYSAGRGRGKFPQRDITPREKDPHTTSAQELLYRKHIHDPDIKSTAYIDLGKNLGKVPIEIGGLGKLSQAETDKRAEGLAETGQFLWDYGSIPAYFSPAAPIAAAFDVARGIVNQDALELALATFGIARPLKSIAPTMSDAAERALSWTFGSGGLVMTAQDLLSSFGFKLSGGDELELGSSEEAKLLSGEYKPRPREWISKDID